MATVESTHSLSTRHELAAARRSAACRPAWALAAGAAAGRRQFHARVSGPARPMAPQNQPAAYVVKVLRKEWWRDPQAIEMQRREAWVGSKVSHPEFAAGAFGQRAGAAVLRGDAEARRRCRSSQLITDQEQLAVPLALWIARQVADGLDALYEATGMIHADVKPANILVSPAGHATLIDFGFVQTPAEASHWATRPLAGTLAYIAPEMVTSSAGRRTAQRYLQPRRHALRNAHRPPAVGQRRPGRTGHAAPRGQADRHPRRCGPKCPKPSPTSSMRCSPKTHSAARAPPANWRRGWCGWKSSASRCGKLATSRAAHHVGFTPR